MNLLNAITIGFKEIWAHKFRSLLTMMGIILGVSSLVAMSALVKGMENGMREEPQRRGGPQPNTALRSDHADAKSYAEEQLNNPNIADEVLVKEASVGHTWDEIIPHQWSNEHKQSVYG